MQIEWQKNMMIIVCRVSIKKIFNKRDLINLIILHKLFKYLSKLFVKYSDRILFIYFVLNITVNQKVLFDKKQLFNFGFVNTLVI